VPLASFASSSRDAWRGRPEVAALFDEAMAVHRVDAAQREHAEQLVWTAYTTPLAMPGGAALARLADAARVVREMDFVFPVTASSSLSDSPSASAPSAAVPEPERARPVYVRGSLDLAFEHGTLTYFADWKTDALASYEPAALGRHVEAHYIDQVHLYALAVVKLLGVATREQYEARFGGLLYVFLRGLDAAGRGLWSARPTWEQVLAWEDALRARRAWGGASGGRGT
jgi:exodeoxyribonuclease V beta subunit